jgi:hypothetical protein
VNCFPEEQPRASGSSVFEFWSRIDHPSMARDLITVTFLLCHQKLSCSVIENFPAFVIENFPALSSKTALRVIENSPALSSKLPRFVIENFPALSS